MDLDQLVSIAESQLVQALTARVVGGFVLALPYLSWLSGPLGWVIGMGIAFAVKYGDLLVYMIGDDWKNTAEGKVLEDAAIKNENTPANDPNKAALEAAQRKAFDDLMGAS